MHRNITHLSHRDLPKLCVLEDDPTNDSTDSENVPLNKLQEKQHEKQGYDDIEKPKGSLNIKTRALVKCKHVQNFKCKLCDKVVHTQKDLNNHHKENHGKLKCAECDESFTMPSSLHRHKYKHSQKNFTLLHPKGILALQKIVASPFKTRVARINT